MVVSSGSSTAILFAILRFRGVKFCEKYGIYLTIGLPRQCLPIIDEICRMSSNFIHRITVVMFVSLFRYVQLLLVVSSCVGHNTLFFTQRYSCTLLDIGLSKVELIVGLLAITVMMFEMTIV